ncbi:hypothetical protein [Lysinibacillus sp. fls2-241-R2A-57]|uniref:hypothetical protein n=1 Tax=Lysinibacillus sp. fls2-241-R2A-57 TaxID=3040292 RepID=UPI0025567BF4|nr:hypothetical protein [Lysinibacillus sp. fls2-241-R2A-57]
MRKRSGSNNKSGSSDAPVGTEINSMLLQCKNLNFYIETFIVNVLDATLKGCFFTLKANN